jgi:hypothetical protein
MACGRPAELIPNWRSAELPLRLNNEACQVDVGAAAGQRVQPGAQ